jgi:hypothetical protein
VHRAEPAEPHQLGDSTRVFAIGLDRHPLPAKASALSSSLAVPARRCPSTPRAASSNSSQRRSATRTPAWPYRAACHFFVCVEQHQIGDLVDIEPIHVAAYIGALQDTAAKLH